LLLSPDNTKEKDTCKEQGPGYRTRDDRALAHSKPPNERDGDDSRDHLGVAQNDSKHRPPFTSGGVHANLFEQWLDTH
jgi:hypothetical protein